MVFQAVLPALLAAPGPSIRTLEYGTHTPAAPPFDFLQKTFLPVLAKVGVETETEMIQPGFYPAGGGKIQISVTPAQKPVPLELTTRTFNHIGCKAVCTQLPGHIAIRELNLLREKLQVNDEHLDQYGSDKEISGCIVSA